MAKQGGENDQKNQGGETPEVKEVIKTPEVKAETPEVPVAKTSKIKVMLVDPSTAFDNDVIKIKFHEVVEVEETDEIRKYISKRRIKKV